MKIVVVYGCWKEVEDEVEVVMEDLWLFLWWRKVVVVEEKLVRVV
jgi:hypothetical protein